MSEPAWDATAEERDAADERLRRAKAFGAFDAPLSPEVSEIAMQALARVGAADHRVPLDMRSTDMSDEEGSAMTENEL